MQCLSCDGTGKSHVEPWESSPNEPCKACGGTGHAPDDEFEAKVREAVAKIGMVYVVRDDVNKRVKIGTALNPLSRLRDLQTGSSVRLRLIAMFPGGRKAEQEFQKIWPDRRLGGEWFDDRDGEVSRIILYTAGTGGGIKWPQP
jgi:hypothetical protein